MTPISVAFRLALAGCLCLLPLGGGTAPAAAQTAIHVADADDSAPTFRVPAAKLSRHPTIIAYGDQRFHDPGNTTVADPKMRLALVKQIALEHPDAVTMSGDVPYKGTDPADYDNYRSETAPWRAARLRVYPALGNHEISGGVQQGVENWWTAFPELRGMRWYSVALGDRISLIQLDSNSPLTPDSPQYNWLRMQLAGLPASVDFVMISLHHPPVADIQTHLEVDHNPRPNEIALRDFLSQMAPSFHASIVVVAGHIHNYERTELNGVTYLVSGGGGAHPYYVERTKEDQYQDVNFPVFHYVKFELGAHELKATMYKVQDPTAARLVWQAKDTFTVLDTHTPATAVTATKPGKSANSAAPPQVPYTPVPIHLP